MLELDPGMMIWTWITFAIVMVILSKTALKPILQAIESRELSVKENLENAERQRLEAQALLEKHNQLLSEAENQGQKIIKENQLLAEKLRQEILERSRAESAILLEKTTREIEALKESALAELRAEVADLAIGAAEKILLENLDESRQKTVVDAYLQSLPKTMNN
jgi:F-type H+-transporting ATPase subunit b